MSDDQKVTDLGKALQEVLDEARSENKRFESAAAESASSATQALDDVEAGLAKLENDLETLGSEAGEELAALSEQFDEELRGSAH